MSLIEARYAPGEAKQLAPAFKALTDVVVEARESKTGEAVASEFIRQALAELKRTKAAEYLQMEGAIKRALGRGFGGFADIEPLWQAAESGIVDHKTDTEVQRYIGLLGTARGASILLNAVLQACQMALQALQARNAGSMEMAKKMMTNALDNLFAGFAGDLKELQCAGYPSMPGSRELVALDDSANAFGAGVNAFSKQRDTDIDVNSAAYKNTIGEQLGIMVRAFDQVISSLELPEREVELHDPLDAAANGYTMQFISHDTGMPVSNVAGLEQQLQKHGSLLVGVKEAFDGTKGAQRRVAARFTDKLLGITADAKMKRRLEDLKDQLEARGVVVDDVLEAATTGAAPYAGLATLKAGSGLATLTYTTVKGGTAAHITEGVKALQAKLLSL